MLGMGLPVRLCGQCGQIPCVVITACVVWWPLGCVYEAGTCSCCRPAPLRCYSVDRSSAGPHAAHKREGGPRPAAPDAKAGGATNVRAASRVALDDAEVSTGGVGLTAGWGSPAVGVFLRKSFAHGSPHLRQPGHHRARDDTGEEHMTQGLAGAMAGRVWAATRLSRVMVPDITC